MQGFLGGALAGIFCVGVCTKRVNQVGVITGLMISTALLAIIKYEFGWHPQTYAAISIDSSFIISYGFSWITSRRALLYFRLRTIGDFLPAYLPPLDAGLRSAS